MKISKVSKKITSVILLVLLLAPMNFAYLRDDDKTEEEKIAELKTNARELLRETSAMALILTSPTNRVNFAIKSADILWDLDETDARAMFNASTEDIKRLMAQVDVETNQLSAARNAGLSGRTSLSRLNSKTSQVLSMRSALVSSLANHDPDWAMRFLQETSFIFTNRLLISRIERDNKRLESTIIRKIAAKDVTKALELGREKLSKGVTPDLLSLLAQIYEKDKEKGAEFAKNILQKLKTSTLKNNQTWIVVQLFQYGLGSSNSGENPLFDKSGMNSLAELLAKQITSSSSRYRKLSPTIISGLEKYSPGSATQIKRSFDQRNSTRNARRGRGNGSGIGVGVGSGNGNTSVEKQRYEERSKFQSEIAADLDSLGDENITDDDRQRIIENAKNKILSVEDENFRFNGLIGLAIRVAKVGEKESASNILSEAENLIKQDPKESRDFSNSRLLANAYAMVDTNRSFVILENMIYRLNGVINGYVQYMQFAGNGRIVENDELIMNNRSRQFTSYLNFSPQAMRNLAENDYVRLKDLTDRFERSEIRVETRLMIAKTLLTAAQPLENNKKSKSVKDVAQSSNLEKRLQSLEDEFEMVATEMESAEKSE